MIKPIITSLTIFLWATVSVAQSQLPYSTETVTSNLRSPWAMAFLPNGTILVSERAGVIRVIGSNDAQRLSGVPDVYFAGQGGLLDIMLDQDFSTNKKIYLSFSHGDRRNNGLRLISATLEGFELSDKKTLFSAFPLKSTAHHYAGRIAQLPDGTLLLSVGDGFDYREQAQKLDSHLGKIIRVDQNGEAPADNPFHRAPGAKTEIWSLGHRNHQALVVSDGTVYQHEHGPQGGDEVNIIKSGLNYGWPIITHGKDYNGASITPFTEYAEMQQPLIDWTPSIAPSSMTMHNGSLYVTSLAEGSIRQLRVDGEKITDQGIVFPEVSGRLRDIVSAPDGHLYVLSDGESADLIKIILE